MVVVYGAVAQCVCVHGAGPEKGVPLTLRVAGRLQRQGAATLASGNVSGVRGVHPLVLHR